MTRLGPEGLSGTLARSMMFTASSFIASMAAFEVRSASSLATLAAPSGLLPVTVSVMTRLVVSEVTPTSKPLRSLMPRALAVELITVDVFAIFARSFASCWEAEVSELVTRPDPSAAFVVCVST